MTEGAASPPRRRSSACAAFGTNAWALLRETYDQWNADGAPRMAAALAHYAAQILLFGAELTHVHATWRDARESDLRRPARPRPDELVSAAR